MDFRIRSNANRTAFKQCGAIRDQASGGNGPKKGWEPPAHQHRSTRPQTVRRPYRCRLIEGDDPTSPRTQSLADHQPDANVLAPCVAVRNEAMNACVLLRRRPWFVSDAHMDRCYPASIRWFPFFVSKSTYRCFSFAIAKWLITYPCIP